MRALRVCWVLLTGLGTAACGGDDGPASTVGVESGGGGMGGMAGSLMLGQGGAGAGAGGKAGAGGTGGGAGAMGGAAPAAGGPSLPAAPDIELHTCPAQPDPPCPPMMLAGDVRISSTTAPETLMGVTAIEGELSITTRVSLDALSCLETVGDNLEIDSFAADTDLSLWGLRNLRTVGGGVDIRAGLDRIWVDCGLRRLESLGEKYITGGAVDTSSDVAGELDLSSLTLVRHIRLRNGQLTRVVLPSNRTLNMGQLLLEDQPYLTEVAGFSGVTIQSASVGGTYSVRIVDNPQFSECRANELAQLFIAGGTPPNTVTIMGNLPCAM